MHRRRSAEVPLFFERVMNQPAHMRPWLQCPECGALFRSYQKTGKRQVTCSTLCAALHFAALRRPPKRRKTQGVNA